MKKLEKALQRQIVLNRAKNMLYDRLAEVIEIDPFFLAVLEDLLASDGEILPEPALKDSVAFASESLIKRLYSINQFLQVEPQKMHQLERIYLHTWRRIVTTKKIHAVLSLYHYPALTRWIASIYPQDFVERLQSLPAIGHVVYEEYSPETQIELLRMDLQGLKQPLLDVGCGNSAGLVRYLRTLQIEAHGIDRIIEKEAGYLRQVDWFGYRFEPGAWGTIISNMAFTKHFLYAYYHDRTKLGLYRQKFYEIIDSLMVGGSFIYAPSVPFVEQCLEADHYQVETFVVVNDIRMTRVMKVAA